MYTTINGIYEKGQVFLQEPAPTEKSMKVLVVFVPRTSWKHLSFIKIPYPENLTTQHQLTIEMAAHETNITVAQKIIDEAASKKQAILNQYL